MNTFPNAEEFKDELTTLLEEFTESQNRVQRQPIRDWLDDFVLSINQKLPLEIKTY